MTFSTDGIVLFKLELLDTLLTAADRVIRPQIPSRRLRPRLQKTFDVKQRRRAKGGLFLSPFWAVMLHDGHRAFGPKTAKFLVYFVNEDDDPANRLQTVLQTSNDSRKTSSTTEWPEIESWKESTRAVARCST